MNPAASPPTDGLQPCSCGVYFIGLTMQTMIEILLVNTKEGTAKKTGNAYKISEAHCVLRNDDGSVGAVGVLNVPKPLEDVAKPGLYTASFALEAPTFGENQGKIIAQLKGLVPVPAGAVKGGKLPSASLPA